MEGKGKFSFLHATATENTAILTMTATVKNIKLHRADTRKEILHIVEIMDRSEVSQATIH